MDFFTIPMKNLRISQNHKEGNHIPHWKDSKDYKDYPVDLCGMDGGRDYLYAPVDMVVTNVTGIGNPKVSNKVFLVSKNKVKTPKFYDYVFMTAVHFEDSDVAKYGIKIGKVFKKGSIICAEGKETATANHLHCTFGIGSASKSVTNSNGKICTLGNTKYMYNICYLDKSFTKVLNKGGYDWTELNTKKVSALLGLALRKSKSTKAEKICTIPYNSVVEVEVFDDGFANGYRWAKVNYVYKDKLVTGYVANKYLK